MALLSASFSACSFSSPLSLSSSFSSRSSTMAIPTGSPISGFLVKPIGGHAKIFSIVGFPAPTTTNKRVGIIVNVSSEIPDCGNSESESDDDEAVPFDKLLLDSKLQQKLEHKMRLKFSKKIRVRRKKLARKRRMRKRGCWPPLKMKKLSNV